MIARLAGGPRIVDVGAGTGLDHLASISVIATLPPPRRHRVLADLEAILVRAGVDSVDVPQVAQLWVTRRR